MSILYANENHSHLGGVSVLRRPAAVILCLLIFIGFTGCNNQKKPQTTGKIVTSVTFNAMKEFVYAVGKDKVEIATLIPDGIEPHDFEPKARDIAQIADSSVFVYNGLSMESWVDQAIASADNKNLIIVEASKGAAPIKASESDSDSDYKQYDPHLWISIKGAEIEAKNIKDALIKASPKDKEYFEKNYSDFISQLESIYSEYSEKFKTLTNKNFVTGHAAFAYLCRDFGLNQKSVEDVFAEGEPSAKKLAELADYCKKFNVKTVFTENMVSPSVSKTLADQVGAKVETIYTFESNEDNLSYIDRMKYNLSKIYGSMK